VYFIAAKQPSGTAGSNLPGNYEFRVEAGGRLALLHQTNTAGGFAHYSSTNTVSPGAWHHVAVTLYAGNGIMGNVYFYVDGIPSGVALENGKFGIVSGEPLRIGTQKDGASYFNGDIDELSLYNRSLSAGEIAALFNSWTNGKCAGQLPPAILGQPSSQTNTPGQNATFSVACRSLAPVSYQWQFNGYDMALATNATLSVTNVTLGFDGFYSVRLTNTNGTTLSAPARLTVQPSGLVPFYSADFEAGAGREWTPDMASNSPTGIGYMGQFGPQTVSLTLTNFPALAVGYVAFDLYIFNTWDGNSVTNGPDYWKLAVGGGATLINTTFSGNQGENQSYPWPFGMGDFPWCTAAVGINLVGYPQANGGSAFIADSVYHLQFAFTNVATNLVLNFSASDLQSLSDESWGLDNVQVYLDGHSGDGWPVVATTTSPPNQILLAGESTDLSVTAAGAAPLGYQWLKNGTPVPGANGPVLHIAGAGTSDAGNYTVIVTNGFGSASTRAAALAVITPLITSYGFQSGGGFTLSFAGLPGATTRVWTSTNLTQGAGWLPIYTNTATTTNGTWWFTDPNTLGFPAKFYRFSTP
jgi:hypothetical protein